MPIQAVTLLAIAGNAFLAPAAQPLCRGTVCIGTPTALVRRPHIVAQLVTPPDFSDEEVFPKGPNGETLITYKSLDKTGAEMINSALVQRNKERMLAGEPKYEDLDAMIDAYMEFEGKEKGLSRQQCEDAVLRFLQKQALLMEGGADFKDPQTIVTFALLALIVVGAGFNVATGQVQIGS